MAKSNRGIVHHRVYPASVTAISETDFWQSLRMPRGEKSSSLRQAIALGREGKSQEAFAELANYHRVSLAAYWQEISPELETAPLPSTAELKKLHQYRIKAWHDIHIELDPKRLDWLSPQLAGGALAGFHYLGWLNPVLSNYAQTGADASRAMLENCICQYDGDQHGPRWDDQYHNLVFSNLPASNRVARFLAAYCLFLNSERAPEPGVVQAVTRQFLAAGRALYLQNDYFVAHNITTHGCRGLLTQGWCFPEFKESGTWVKRGTQRMVQQATEGFYKDGCHHERVWGYGSHTLDSLDRIYRLGVRLDGWGKQDAAMKTGIMKAYNFFAQTVGPRPQHFCPSYGDGALMSFAAIVEKGRRFGREMKAGDLKRGDKSMCFSDSGFAALRNGDDETSTYANFTFGPFAGWHSHQDLFSLNLHAYGEPFIEESLRFGPYSNPLEFFFRSPKAHNLFLMDGMVYDCRSCKGENVVWQSNTAVDVFSATHRAYRYFVFGEETGGVGSPNIEGQVRRSLIFVKDPGYLVVVDSVLNANDLTPVNRAATQLWHSRFPFTQVSKRVVALRGSKAGCLLAFARPEGLVRMDMGVDFTEEEGARFGKSHNSYFLKAHRWMDLPHPGTVGFATLIFPYTGSRPKISIRALDNDASKMWLAERYEVTTSTGKDIISVNPDGMAKTSFRKKGMAPLFEVELGSGRGKMRV